MSRAHCPATDEDVAIARRLLSIAMHATYLRDDRTDAHVMRNAITAQRERGYPCHAARACVGLPYDEFRDILHSMGGN